LWYFKSSVTNVNHRTIDEKSFLEQFESQLSTHHSDVKTVSLHDLLDENNASVVLVNESRGSGPYELQAQSTLSERSGKYNTTSDGSPKAKKIVGKSSSHFENTTRVSSSQQARKHSSRTKHKKGTATPASSKKMESSSLDLSDNSSKKYWWDYLVDEGGAGDLMLGSKLDKGGKERDVDGNEFDETGSAKNEKKTKQNNEVNGNSSFVSLRSDDFKFSED